MTKYKLRFHGSVSDAELQMVDQNSEILINRLRKNREVIRSLIETEIARELPEIDRIHVDIDFEYGSVEWLGEVTVYIDWMARLGGAAVFMIMLKDAVRWSINRILTRSHIPNARTVVRVTYPTRAVDLMYRSEGSQERFLGAILALTAFNTLLLMIMIILAFYKSYYHPFILTVMVAMMAVYVLSLVVVVFHRR